ncbi:hypothetical protein FJR48_02335 [Sulfurimonas lithotrophica]|uniref:JHP0747 family n=1 Tax=Sulfurimonas lithotrophica TaxID=2590022 RepID=A0A5P8NYV8_9BACT|nr:hypothetical protein [Sulfurimonas lithotrophica]QFR48625.1 hypothetical protein FJR48_02335 [Sulfurimonas lithotrophica]
MRVAVECKSPLLQKSLETFLKKYLSSNKQCDILIRDEECLGDERCFFIGTKNGADLLKPFSKSQLILALENRYKTLDKTEQEPVEEFEVEESMNFEILQKRIEFLTKKYQEDIINSIKAFYEK